jgi:hypothetical protein
MGTVLNITIAVLFFGLLVFNYEWNRFQGIYYKSKVTWAENHRILQQDICQNAVERIILGPKVRTLCERAHHENQLDPRLHAFQTWWKTSEVMALYNRVAGTWWIVVGIILFTIGVAIKCGYAYLITTRRDKQYIDIARECMKLGQREQQHHYSWPMREKRYSIEKRL